MIYKNASYASWPDDRGHAIAKFEGRGGGERQSRDQGKRLL